MKWIVVLLSLALFTGACAPGEAPHTLSPHFKNRHDSPFELGVNVHLDGLPHLQRAADMGAAWVRMDLNWDSLEPSPGAWNFSAPDATVAAAQSLGLKIYATLAYAPAWARKGPDNRAVPDPGAWNHFVTTVARRYCGRIQAYGIWNEPNLEEFWTGSTEQYVEILLKPAAIAIKSEDPQALIAGPDLAHLYSARLGIQEFFETLSSLGGGDSLDILSHHIYSSNEFTQKLFGFHAGDMVYRPGLAQMLAQSNLETKEVWITEMGADSREHGEAAQAAQLVAQIRLMKAQPWIAKAFIYQLGDDSGEGPQWGLIRQDETLKPAYFDVRSLIQNEL